MFGGLLLGLWLKTGTLKYSMVPEASQLPAYTHFRPSKALVWIP